VSGLEGGQLLKLRRGVLKVTIQIVREQIEIAVGVDEAAVYATVILVANAVQTCRISDRQRFQQNCVDQREDGGVRPNPQSDGKNHRGRKPRRLPKLPQRKSDILHVWES